MTNMNNFEYQLCQGSIMISLNYENIKYVMSQILKLSCVSFRYVSISYVLANAHCPFLRGLRHSEMQGYVAAAGKKSRILEQDQRS